MKNQGENNRRLAITSSTCHLITYCKVIFDRNSRAVLNFRRMGRCGAGITFEKNFPTVSKLCLETV